MSSHSRSEITPPSLDFGWEEDLFSALLGIYRKLRPNRSPEGACLSEPHLENLTVVARVVSGLAVNVAISKGAGGVRNLDILVPRVVGHSTDYHVNLATLTVHVLMNATMAKILTETRLDGDPSQRETQLRLAVQARDSLMNEWPVFVKLWDVAALAALDAVAGLANTPEGSILRGEAAATQHRDAPYIAPLLWGKIFEISQGGGGRSTDELQQDGQEISTEIQGQNPEDVRVVLVDEKNQKEMPSHIFEKVETADEYRGEQRHTDGDDELDEHLTALEELDLNSMYRGGAPASSLYKADIRLHLDIPDVHSVSASERAIQYDEWDARKGRYKQNWVSVYPTSLPVVANSYAQRIADEKRGQITHLTRRLKNYRQNLRPQRRQFDGEDVDIDALIQETAASTAGHGGNTRMYERRVRSTRSIATTVLLDISLSADSWVQNRRVLDVAREAIVVLGEVTNTLGDDLQILAFGSNTRNLVRVFSLKDWSESWARARHRLGSVTPQGYTRIGPALRHATADILKRPANRRMVLLLSDGKPTDYDRYEGNYGIKDVRQAVREANGNGVHVFGFAIDQLARNYLPAMLGEHNWTMMPHADALSDGLTDIYGRATK